MCRPEFQPLPPTGLAQSYLVPSAPNRRLVNDPARLVGHAELARAECRIDIFGCGAHKTDFEVVDHCRAVHCNGSYESTPHQIDQHGPQPGLYDVAADPCDNSAALPLALPDKRRQFLQLAGSKDVRKAVQEIFERSVRADGPGEVFCADFAWSGLQRVGANLRKVQRLFAVARHLPDLTSSL